GLPGSPARAWLACWLLPRPPRATLSPYTTLFRSARRRPDGRRRGALPCAPGRALGAGRRARRDGVGARRRARAVRPDPAARAGGDRKSTRLNSSHVKISYAVFCLKKKSTGPSATP